ncbi:G1/S-specific cyclin-D3 [Striga asiatica]|uniref:G1/S-specific cyclin-D3 n=1 Tax=Striga asiatica TaxID=4170 RepID=A0A5A7QWH4_STRAF|nr:G1/S-specific cyclin-D3 [Striga asiatica]
MERKEAEFPPLENFHGPLLGNQPLELGLDGSTHLHPGKIGGPTQESGEGCGNTDQQMHSRQLEHWEVAEDLLLLLPFLLRANKPNIQKMKATTFIALCNNHKPNHHDPRIINLSSSITHYRLNN